MGKGRNWESVAFIKYVRLYFLEGKEEADYDIRKGRTYNNFSDCIHHISSFPVFMDNTSGTTINMSGRNIAENPICGNF